MRGGAGVVGEKKDRGGWVPVSLWDVGGRKLSLRRKNIGEVDVSATVGYVFPATGVLLVLLYTLPKSDTYEAAGSNESQRQFRGRLGELNELSRLSGVV